MKHKPIDWTAIARLLPGALAMKDAASALMPKAKLHPGQSAHEVADALIVAAGQIEIAETRVW